MKRILVVDDEQHVLDGIRTMLRRRRNEWEMEFVDSGAAALAALEKQPYDLICSDMRMPTMDGAQLLTAVSERWPQIVRIVLSGYSELAQTIRLVPIAHQYISKPCNSEQLNNILDRCLNVQEMLGRPALRELVGRVRKLPALPRTYAKLRDAMAEPNVTATDIAKIVAGDTAIAAKVLQVVNSAFFRLARQITKIEQAVSYLGFAAIRNLVMSVEVFSQWNQSAAACGFDLERMQSESTMTAAAARALSAGTSLTDDAMVVGLLHDIGYLILLVECPEQLQAAREEAVKRGIPAYQTEREILGASHAEVGAYLLALWGLPFSIVEAVAHHHQPLAVAHTDFDLLSVLAIAEGLMHTPDVPSLCGAADFVVDDDFLKQVHAPFTLSHAQECVQEIKTAGANL